ncbi:hypothetical protein [Breznakiella homolactica]|uniref:Guanylate cyclase domain-containing protein n=1 Tax=Breznakiella homolactica TaxID=2798577 RepID=A0A7T8BAU3_9SPIR|nr:hypothetical protein [Breznakiella homolactica]QQO09857.1 hypothetical protein JFL75_02810 [Breznakiella homolactica]
MKIKNITGSFCRKCLQESIPVDLMVRFAKIVSPEYDLYKRTGLNEGMAISNQDAARRVVADLIRDGQYIDFVEALIQIDAKGYMGRRYTLKGLNDVVSGVIQEGYTFDRASGQFFENQNERITDNWGRLKDGDERMMAVLRLDVVSNSSLVKQNSAKSVDKAYRDLRNIVTQSVVYRLGRLWSWEGDGALAVFLFGYKEKAAVYAGMNILHELYFYNRLDNPLNNPIKVRLAVHMGPVRYWNNTLERIKNETVKETVLIESQATPADALGVSHNVFLSIDRGIQELFSGEKSFPGGRVRNYTFGMEKA